MVCSIFTIKPPIFYLNHTLTFVLKETWYKLSKTFLYRYMHHGIWPVNIYWKSKNSKKGIQNHIEKNNCYTSEAKAIIDNRDLLLLTTVTVWSLLLRLSDMLMYIIMDDLIAWLWCSPCCV